MPGYIFLSQNWDTAAPSTSDTSTQVQRDFDFVFILIVWIEPQLDVGDDKRGGHQNKTLFLITTHPTGH